MFLQYGNKPNTPNYYLLTEWLLAFVVFIFIKNVFKSVGQRRFFAAGFRNISEHSFEMYLISLGTDLLVYPYLLETLMLDSTTLLKFSVVIWVGLFIVDYLISWPIVLVRKHISPFFERFTYALIKKLFGNMPRLLRTKVATLHRHYLRTDGDEASNC